MRHYWKRGEDLGGAILAGALDGWVLLPGLDADRCPLCSSRPAARLRCCNRLACRTPGFTPTVLVQKGTLQNLSPWSSLYFLKSESQSLTCPHPFVLDPLKGSSLSAKGQSSHCLLSHTLLLLLWSVSCPWTTPPPPPCLRHQNQNPGFFLWKSETEKLSPFSPLQGKIFSWKGMPWGPGALPPCPPPGPGDQHLQAGNTQTTVRPGPRGLERAASLAGTTGVTTTTTGGWST